MAVPCSFCINYSNHALVFRRHKYWPLDNHRIAYLYNTINDHFLFAYFHTFHSTLYIIFLWILYIYVTLLHATCLYSTCYLEKPVSLFIPFLTLLFLFLLKYSCIYIEIWVSVGNEIGFFSLLWCYVAFLGKIHRNDYLCQIGHQQSTEMILWSFSLINNEFVEVTSRSMAEGLCTEMWVILGSYMMVYDTPQHR